MMRLLGISVLFFSLCGLLVLVPGCGTTPTPKKSDKMEKMETKMEKMEGKMDPKMDKMSDDKTKMEKK